MNPFEQARSLATPEARASIDLIEAFIEKLEAMDFEAVGHFFSEDGAYCDEPMRELDGVGPAGVTAKLGKIVGFDAFPMCVDTVVGDAAHGAASEELARSECGRGPLSARIWATAPRGRS